MTGAIPMEKEWLVLRGDKIVAREETKLEARQEASDCHYPSFELEIIAVPKHGTASYV